MALRQEKVSERLLELREHHGLSQEDAARKVGITHRQWQRWETGESMPYPRNLDAVASAFGISIVEFFDPDEPVVPDAPHLARIEDRLAEQEKRLDALLERLPADAFAVIAQHQATLIRLAEEAAKAAAAGPRSPDAPQPEGAT